MCHQASQTAAALMKAIEPTITSLLALEVQAGKITAEQQTTTLNAYNAALSAAENWNTGTDATVAIEAVDAFVSVFNALPFPQEVSTLVNIISAGIVSVLAIFTANSPATVQTNLDQHAVHAEAAAQVHELTGVKMGTVTEARSLLGDTHAGANRYTSEWNKAVEQLGGQYAGLKQ